MARYTSGIQIKRSSTLPKWILGIVVGIVAGALLYNLYLQQHGEVARLNQQTTQLNQQVNQLNKDLAAAKATPPPPASSYMSPKGVAITVYTPTSNARVVSPVVVLGEVPGSWSFEASFPVKLLDSKGNIVARATAQLLGTWTTDRLVPFSAKLIYNTNSIVHGSGTLISRDNPSGLPTNDDSVSIPIRLL